jgi:hypothetical protein
MESECPVLAPSIRKPIAEPSVLPLALNKFPRCGTIALLARSLPLLASALADEVLYAKAGFDTESARMPALAMAGRRFNHKKAPHRARDARLRLRAFPFASLFVAWLRKVTATGSQLLIRGIGRPSRPASGLDSRQPVQRLRRHSSSEIIENRSLMRLPGRRFVTGPCEIAHAAVLERARQQDHILRVSSKE